MRISAYACGALAIWLAMPVPCASAQTTGSDRPFRGIFGGRGQGTGSHSLDVTATLVEAYDDNLLAERGGVTAGAPSVSGFFTMLQTGADYSWAGRTAKLEMNAASAWRYYGQVGEVDAVSHAGGIGLTAEISRRTTASIGGSAAYSPSYLFGLFPTVSGPTPGDSPAPAPDYAVNDDASYSYGTSASLTRGFTRRGSLRFSADYSFTDYVNNGELGREDMESYGGRAEFSRSLGRRTSLTMGYQYRAGNYGVTLGGTATEHGVQIGVDHTKILSASRRAQFGVGLGVTTVDAELPRAIGPDTATAPIRGRLASLSGAALLSYQFARDWELAAAYRRQVMHNPELSEPVFVDGVSAWVQGLLTRRLDLHVGAAYSSGESALYTVSAFDTYTGVVRARYAFARTVGAYLEDLYFFYDFSGSTLLRPGMSPRLERNGVRGGLTFFLPAFRR